MRRLGRPDDINNYIKVQDFIIMDRNIPKTDHVSHAARGFSLN